MEGRDPDFKRIEGGMGELTSLSVFDLHICSWVDEWAGGWTYVGSMGRWKQRETAGG